MHLRQGKVNAAIVARDHQHLPPIGPDEAPRILRISLPAVKGIEPLLARAGLGQVSASAFTTLCLSCGVAAALLMLEMQNVVMSLPGKIYKLSP